MKNGNGNGSGAREDRRLVGAYLETREERAFRTLYGRHAPVIFHLLVRLTKGRGNEAEEILQSTWIRAAQKLDGFRWESSLRTWLTGIALNCYRERVRRETRRPAMESLDARDVPPPVRVTHEIARIDLERAISQLPDGYREVLILHDIEGYTHDEIGELLGIRNGTSKSQLSRARRSVRKWLVEEKEHAHEPRTV